MKHQGPISGISTSVNGYVATAGYDNRVILWDAASHLPVARVAHDHLANQCSFSPDGRHLVTSSSDYSARVWEVPSMRLVGVLGQHRDDVEMSSFSPDGQRVATCSRDGNVRVFSLDGKLEMTCVGHSADVISVSWSPDATTLLSSSDDGTVRHWDARTGECISLVDLGGVETDTLAVINPELVIAGNDDGELVAIGGAEPIKWKAHDAGIKRVVYSAEKGLLVSLSYDRSLALWRIAANGSAELVDRADLPAIVWPRSCSFLGEEKLVFGTFGHTYAVYDFHQKQWASDFIERDESINAVASADGNLYTVGDAGIVFENGVVRFDAGSLCNFIAKTSAGLLTAGQLGQLFDVRSRGYFHWHSAPINCCVVYNVGNSERAVFGTYDGLGLMFEVSANGVPVFQKAVKLHENAIKGLSYRNGFVFTACATGAVGTFHADSLEGLEGFEGAHTRIANGCAAYRDGFASIGRDLKLRLWGESGEAECIDTPHVNSIKCIAVSESGSMIATGSYGGAVAIYDVDQKQWIEVRKVSIAGISSLTWHDDHFVAASYDGKLHAMPVAVSAVEAEAA